MIEREAEPAPGKSYVSNRRQNIQTALEESSTIGRTPSVLRSPTRHRHHRSALPWTSDWSSRRGSGARGLAVLQRSFILGRSDCAVRVHLRFLPASERWHSPPRVGHRAWVRAPLDIRLGVGGRCGERGVNASRRGSPARSSEDRVVDRRNTRSPLARAAGLGRQNRREDWWAERVRHALVPCTWFAASLIANKGGLWLRRWLRGRAAL